MPVFPMRSLAPTLPALSPLVGYQSGNARSFDRYRADTQPWRQWYRTSRWQKLRWSVLTEQLFTCQNSNCKRVIVPSSEAVADHVVPHRGDPRLFWDRSNLQCLCKPCHDSAKQREERMEAMGGRVNPPNERFRPDLRAPHAQNFSRDG